MDLVALQQRDKDITRSLKVANRRIGRMNWGTARWAAYMQAISKLLAEQKQIRALLTPPSTTPPAAAASDP